MVQYPAIRYCDKWSLMWLKSVCGHFDWAELLIFCFSCLLCRWSSWNWAVNLSCSLTRSLADLSQLMTGQAASPSQAGIKPRTFLLWLLNCSNSPFLEQESPCSLCLFGLPLKTTWFRSFPMSWVHSKENNPVLCCHGVIMDPNKLYSCGLILNISSAQRKFGFLTRHNLIPTAEKRKIPLATFLKLQLLCSGSYLW